MKLTERINKELGEAEMSLKSNPKLHKKVMDKLAKQKYNLDAEHHMTLVKAMNPKKLSRSDLDTLQDFDDMYEGVDEFFSKNKLKYYIKATSKNQDALEKQGLSSKDPAWYYDMYNEIMDGKPYELIDKHMAPADRDFLMMLADKHGLKF